MDNPVSTVKEAARTAFSPKWILVVLIVGLMLFAAFDALGWTNKLLYPVSSIKKWNEDRKRRSGAPANL